MKYTRNMRTQLVWLQRRNVRSPMDKTGVLDALPKFKKVMNPNSYRMAHPIYKLEDIETIKPYHHEPKGWS